MKKTIREVLNEAYGVSGKTILDAINLKTGGSAESIAVAVAEDLGVDIGSGSTGGSGEAEGGSESIEPAITLATQSIGDVEFANGDCTLTTEDGYNFVVGGTLATMSEEQSTAFWGNTQGAGSKYIAISFPAISESNAVTVSGWVENAESETYNDQKSGNTDNWYVIALTKGESAREELNGCTMWKCVLADNTTITIDFSGV